MSSQASFLFHPVVLSPRSSTPVFLLSQVQRRTPEGRVLPPPHPGGESTGIRQAPTWIHQDQPRKKSQRHHRVRPRKKGQVSGSKWGHIRWSGVQVCRFHFQGLVVISVVPTIFFLIQTIPGICCLRMTLARSQVVARVVSGIQAAAAMVDSLSSKAAAVATPIHWNYLLPLNRGQPLVCLQGHRSLWSILVCLNSPPVPSRKSTPHPSGQHNPAEGAQDHCPVARTAAGTASTIPSIRQQTPHGGSNVSGAITGVPEKASKRSSTSYSP